MKKESVTNTVVFWATLIAAVATAIVQALSH